MERSVTHPAQGLTGFSQLGLGPPPPLPIGCKTASKSAVLEQKSTVLKQESLPFLRCYLQLRAAVSSLVRSPPALTELPVHHTQVP